MKRNLITIISIFLLVGIALYTNVIHKNGSNVFRPEVGFKAPELSLTSLDNRTYKLSSIDKPVVLDFWASWCGPCQQESPTLAKLYNKYKDQVEFLGINLTANDKLESVKNFVNKYQVKFPVLLDQDGKTADAYQVSGIPTSFFIDRDKHIVNIAQGLHTEEELDKMIQAIVARK